MRYHYRGSGNGETLEVDEARLLEDGPVRETDDMAVRCQVTILNFWKNPTIQAILQKQGTLPSLQMVDILIEQDGRVTVELVNDGKVWKEDLECPPTFDQYKVWKKKMEKERKKKKRRMQKKGQEEKKIPVQVKMEEDEDEEEAEVEEMEMEKEEEIEKEEGQEEQCKEEQERETKMVVGVAPGEEKEEAAAGEEEEEHQEGGPLENERRYTDLFPSWLLEESEESSDLLPFTPCTSHSDEEILDYWTSLGLETSDENLVPSLVD